jgi:hypothetical protein
MKVGVENLQEKIFSMRIFKLIFLALTPTLQSWVVLQGTGEVVNRTLMFLKKICSFKLTQSNILKSF